MPKPAPPDHELRRLLADELHARPATGVECPSVASCMAITGATAGAIHARVVELAELHGAEPPRDVSHAILELGVGRLKWERHGEFTSLTVVRALPSATLAGLAEFPTAFDILPDAWLESLPGTIIAAADIVVLRSGKTPEDFAAVERWLASSTLSGSEVLDNAASVFTDFVLPSQGRTRWIVLDAELGIAQRARVVHRIIEIEIYRMMALLALPAARDRFHTLTALEDRLATLTGSIAAAHDGEEIDERGVLDALTKIAAEVERSISETVFRFAASGAYWDIVKSRVAELREHRIGDIRTLNGFLARRLAPAMETVRAASRRQDELSTRIGRASELLQTRVEVAREEQNQALLAGMDRRGEQQLRLQETVEGLSIAAVTYYVTSLIGHAAKPLEHLLPHFDAEAVAALSIPVVGFVMWRALRKVRASIAAKGER